MDDRRVGLLLRALRRRRGWRQSDLARAARVSQSVVSRAERGHLPSAAALRSVAAALDARVEYDLRWRGGELGRLVDERHARLATHAAAELERFAWIVMPEVTFMRAGERGSIDLLGVDRHHRAVAVIEIKPELLSYEETQRRLDVKIRVARSVAAERLGWAPSHVAVILVLADTSSNRDRASRVRPLLRAGLPAGNVELRRWLRRPGGDMRAVWFLREMRPRTETCRPAPPHRVRRRRESSPRLLPGHDPT